MAYLTRAIQSERYKFLNRSKEPTPRRLPVYGQRERVHLSRAIGIIVQRGEFRDGGLDITAALTSAGTRDPP
jgi:hypothetical protein